MPIFKVTVKEEITRRTVAYVDAPTSHAADEWASNAHERHFKQEGEEDIWSEVDRLDQIDAAPATAKIHTLATV